MELRETMLQKVFTKCDLMLGEKLFSGEMIVARFGEYLAQTSDKEDHNVGIILHTGSDVFDAMAIAFAAVANCVTSAVVSEDIIANLEEGDFVLYGKETKKRYIFKSITESPYNGEECVKLLQGDSDISYIPKKSWRYISPYHGSSTRTDGRGIRKKQTDRNQFYKTVLGFDENDIPSDTGTSTVIMMPKDRADFIMKNLVIQFDGISMPILDLVTASYFTENDELYYGGNTGKVDPVLKITGRASVARRLIRKKDGKKCNGVMILGDEIYRRNESELPEIITRKSLKYVYVSMHIDSSAAVGLVEEHEDAAVFACTRDFLLTNSTGVKVKNTITKELAKQIDAVIDRELHPLILNGNMTWSSYKEFRKALFFLKSSAFSSGDKETFVINAFSLMNFFLTSPFKVSEVEELVSSGRIDIVSPSERMGTLRELSKTFPEGERRAAETALDVLEDCYLLLSDHSEKENELKKLLREHTASSVALVVPKAYYAVILRELGFCDLMRYPNLLTISTANKFDNTRVYDLIIVLGDYEGKRFDAFRCRSSQQIITLLYDFEANIFKYKLKRAEQNEKLFDRRSVFDYPIGLDYEDFAYDENESEDAISEVEQIQSEVDEYITKLNDQALLNSVGFTEKYSGGTAEVIAIVSFETGEKALLTKRYQAYIFDGNTGEVQETDAGSISEGDSMIFTRGNDRAKDIVDLLLERLIESGKDDEELKQKYALSKRWKEALLDHMHNSGSTEREIAAKMIENGVSVKEQTIRVWMDPDAHTVGPRKKESIQQIALLAEDDDLFENADACFKACRDIRSARRRILKDIGKAIISRIKGEPPEMGTWMADVFDRIDSLAEVLTVESVTSTEQKVPNNVVNRPIMMKEQKNGTRNA